MPDNNDYTLTVFCSGAFENNKAYKILKEKYSKTDPDKISNASFRLEYLAKADRFFLSADYISTDGKIAHLSNFVSPNNHYPFYDAYIIGDEEKNGIMFSAYLRIEDNSLYLVLTQSLLKQYESPEKENTKILAKYPLHYPGIDMRKIIDDKKRLGWESDFMGSDGEPFTDVFGDDYYPDSITIEKNNGIRINFR